MNDEEFLTAMNKLADNYKRKLEPSTYELYWKEFKNCNKDKFNDVINDIMRNNKFFPTIAEINTALIERESSRGNINLNSSYWYENLKYFCDRDGIPYYDITKGIDFPLPPYKDWEDKNETT